MKGGSQMKKPGMAVNQIKGMAELQGQGMFPLAEAWAARGQIPTESIPCPQGS